MKKELLISIGSITTTVLVNKLCKYCNEKKQKRILEDPFRILDPFVNYYYSSMNFDGQFKKVICEKMTIDELKMLKVVFEQREESLKGKKEAIAYYHYLNVIDQYLPVEASLQSFEELKHG